MDVVQVSYVDTTDSFPAAIPHASLIHISALEGEQHHFFVLRCAMGLELQHFLYQLVFSSR
jgi:hypothetical protein